MMSALYRRMFVNRPLSALLIWPRRAHQQWQAGTVETVVCLIPVRTDSALLHETLVSTPNLSAARLRALSGSARQGAAYTVRAHGADARRHCRTEGALCTPGPGILAGARSRRSASAC